jgi:hypothetical protein
MGVTTRIDVTLYQGIYLPELVVILSRDGKPLVEFGLLEPDPDMDGDMSWAMDMPGAICLAAKGSKGNRSGPAVLVEKSSAELVWICGRGGTPCRMSIPITPAAARVLVREVAKRAKGWGDLFTPSGQDPGGAPNALETGIPQTVAVEIDG